MRRQTRRERNKEMKKVEDTSKKTDKLNTTDKVSVKNIEGKKASFKNNAVALDERTTIKTVEPLTPKAETSEVKETYEEVEYASNSFSNCAIASMGARAKIFGLDPVSPDKARVLELGCSFGGNIISQALYHPNAHFVGVDLSSKQIAKGKEIIKSMKLDNIQLVEKDILDIDEDFGTFDYIIVHGIWSWVPDAVKDKILSICNKNLSDRGVAYVSYNTYPGWKRLEQFRDIMLYSTRNKKDMSLADRTVYGKKVLELLGQTMNMDQNIRQNQGYKLRNLLSVLNANNYYVSHEYFEIFNDPVYFHEFAERAAKQGCAYICDCTMSLSYVSYLPDQIKQNILKLAEGDPIAKEQYIDFMNDTQFRCSLLTKATNEKKIRRDEQTLISTLRGLYFYSNLINRTENPETNTFYHAIRVLMNSGRVFNSQDVIDYLAKTYPGITIDEGVILSRLFFLLMTNNLRVLDEKVSFDTFEDHISYVTERYLNYIEAMVEGGANTYISSSNKMNSDMGGLDKGLLYVARLLKEPTTKEELVKHVAANLTVTRKTRDGLSYHVAPAQFVDEMLYVLSSFSFLAKK